MDKTFKNDTDTKTIDRTDREVDVRESKVKSWAPASSLPEFNQKAGWSYRWVRSSLLNEPDNMNVSAKMREGWEPVKHSEHPEIQLAADPNSQYKDSIEIGGVLLCKIPSEFMDQRRAHIDRATQQQTQAVDAQFMAQNDPRMPKFAEGNESGNSGRFGKGNK